MKKFLLTSFGGILVYDYVIGVVASVSVGLGLWTLLHSDPKPIVTQTSPNTITVQVPGPITTKTVTEFVTDKVEVAKLLAENKKLKIQVTQLTESLAEYKSHGEGPVTEVRAADVPATLLPSFPPVVDPGERKVMDFKDYRLHFVSDGLFAKYDLTQRFEVLTTTGKTKDGIPTTTVKLFELGPQDVRMPVTSLKTVAIFAGERGPHWYLRPHVQAGFAVTQTGTNQRMNGGIVGIQWLKHGKSHAPRDTTFSLLTPVVFVSDTVQELGLLPLSYNIGSIKKQPFTNLWVSPYVGFSKTVSRVGISLTATF